MMSRALAALAWIGLTALAYAGDIYRWVDENGKTHFADLVPEKYKRSAIKVEPRAAEPTEAERRQAAERAAAERARAAATTSQSTHSANSAAAQTGAAAGQSGDRIAPLDCDTEHRLYRQSIDCFSRFMTQSGAVRAEAFQHCTEVKDPSLRCGPPKPESTERTYVNPGSARTY